MKWVIEKLKWFFKIGWTLESTYMANEMWAMGQTWRNKKTGEKREVIYD